MPTTFETEMMNKCCSTEGKVNFDKMKQFMEVCGKTNFDNEELAKMKQFCEGQEKPDCETLHTFIENCGCKCE